MGWESSTRRSTLPSDWAKRRAKVKARANGRCEAYWTAGRTSHTDYHVPECDGYGNECDHIDRGDDHSLTNLQWLSTPCHAAKTRAAKDAANAAKRAALKLPAEAHPSGIPNRTRPAR